MRVIWTTAKIIRWALLIGVAGSFAMTVVYIDVNDGSFERYAELFVLLLVEALIVGFIERWARLKWQGPVLTKD